MKLTFLGATDTVTGSKYLVEANDRRILVDCGLYQGIKQLRERNWKPLPIDAKRLDAIILTHAHIDHSGYIPVLTEQGYVGPIYCSPGTQALCDILLPDCGFLQEEDARFANKHKFSKHHPAKPLYTAQDARHALKQFHCVPYNKMSPVIPGKTGNSSRLKFMLTPVGHILGASAVHIDDGNKRLVFSGDLGRYNDPMLFDPEPVTKANTLVVESTYGDREHPQVDGEAVLETIINETMGRGGTVLIPSFAVGRAQLVLYYLMKLKSEDRIPSVPIYLNSPMAISATEAYKRFSHMHKLDLADCSAIDSMTHYVRTVEESIALNEQNFPSIIISASGMATGGRVLHHMKKLIGNHKNSVVFAGYQAMGTRGQKILRGDGEIKIHGQHFRIKAEIHNLSAFSAHADSGEILKWLSTFEETPSQVYVTHGERESSDCMRSKIIDQLGWQARVPELGETVGI